MYLEFHEVGYKDGCFEGALCVDVIALRKYPNAVLISTPVGLYELRWSKRYQDTPEEIDQTFSDIAEALCSGDNTRIIKCRSINLLME
jgi:hypothetical protein